MANYPDERATLDLAVEKAHKLENSRFAQYLLSGGKTGVTGHISVDESVIGFSGPDEDAVDAFALTIRYFLQNNERISFANLDALFSGLPLSQALRDSVRHSRQEINSFLDSNSFITLASAPLTRRHIFDIFLYGGLAHANKTKKETYDKWAARAELFPYLQLEFIGTGIELLNCIFWFSHACERARAELDALP